MIWWRCFIGITWRELLRFTHQRGRFFSALVRPLLWLLVFAVGFRTALGDLTTPPYESRVTYEVYIVPGLVGMIQLFNGMQSSLSMVYDREVGSMRMLLTSPLPRWWLLTSKLMASVVVSVLQVYAFLLIAAFFKIVAEPSGYLCLLPGLLVTGMLLGSIGMFLSSSIRQLENFAGVMNFVVFPLFFLSSALYPLSRMRESSEVLYYLCIINPFTHAVELIRFALQAQWNADALLWTLLFTAFFLTSAVWGYKPGRGASLRAR